MAVNWAAEAGVQRTAHGYSVLPENLVILPELSGRMDATDITDLAKDIDVNGQLEQGVCWKNEQGWPVLAAGHRRYRAVVRINEGITDPDMKRRFLFNFIPAKNESEAFDYTVRENRNRVNPSPLDDAHNMHVYQTRFGLSEEQIARKYFPGDLTQDELTKALRYVKECLALLELSPTAQEELRRGFFSTSAALQLAAIPSRKTQDEVIAQAKSQGKKKIKVEEAKQAKESAQGKPKSSPVKISDNAPAKLLEKHKILAELAAACATEILCAEDPDQEVLMDYSRSILKMANDLRVPLLPEASKYLKDNPVVETPLSQIERRELAYA